jgi:hypothetical protein
MPMDADDASPTKRSLHPRRRNPIKDDRIVCTPHTEDAPTHRDTTCDQPRRLHFWKLRHD